MCECHLIRQRDFADGIKAKDLDLRLSQIIQVGPTSSSYGSLKAEQLSRKAATSQGMQVPPEAGTSQQRNRDLRSIVQ